MTEQKNIPRKVWYGLDGSGYNNIAQELKSEELSLRKWASIYAIYKYPFSDDPHQYYDFIHNSKHSRYVAIIFTLAIETIEISDGIDDRDISITAMETMNSEEEIKAFLEKHKLDPELFAPPWRCEYPL